MAYTEQEKLASHVSRRVNKRVTWATNRDGSLDVYCPSKKIVFNVASDLAVTWRPAKDERGAVYPLWPENEFYADKIVASLKG